METRFDWERLDFAKYRIFFLRDPIFEVFSVKVNKGGCSSHLLQNRILKNVLEPDLHYTSTVNLVHFIGVASGKIFAMGSIHQNGDRLREPKVGDTRRPAAGPGSRR